MVIGNGFFSENRQTALAEMTERSKCEVRHLPFPTVGNITYYISYTGDLYGQQMIQGRPLTRQRKHQKYSIGYTARLSAAPHKEANYHLQVLTWSAFVLNRWQPDVDLEFKNGNPYDVRPCNLQERVEAIPLEWAATMDRRKGHAGLCSEERSLISPDYARNFICDFIIGKKQTFTQPTLFDL